MIEIRMETKRLKMTVDGHATPEEGPEYAEICAAVSAISQSMVFALTRAKEGTMLKSLEYRPIRGDFKVHAYAEDGMEGKLAEIFVLYGYGLELLAQSHPQSVTMIIDGRRVKEDGSYE